ncbi:MAG: hypothetical protein M3512_17620 [Bacteroidota bacterium]|nr:hypothetical protein [Bacteroidota bacterium]
MNNNIDKLFKGKLKGHEVAPSPAAWQNLQGKLNQKKKNRYFLYYKIAAAVLLVLIPAFAYISLVNQNDTGKSVDLVIVKAEKPDRYTSDNNAPKPNQDKMIATVPTLNDEKEGLKNKVVLEKVKKLKKIAKSSNEQFISKTEITTKTDFNIESQLNLNGDALVINEDPIPKTNDVEEPLPKITITYKKGTEKEMMTEATPKEGDGNTIRKILRMAKEIKNSEITLHDIRKTKEELFALEIIKNKNSKY